MTDPLPLEIDVTEAAKLLGERPQRRVLLLDCRTPEEDAIARIPDALLVPMGEITERVGELEPWRDATVIVHCHHGIRSLRVAQWLRGRGFANVTSMRGGIDAWSAAIDPTVPVY